MREQLMIQTDRVYQIQRTAQGVVCTVNGRPLPLRLDLWNHSPTGFEFGYGGSGPAQLALAILADCCGDELAIVFHQAFKREVIARIPGPGGSLTGTFVRDVLARLQREKESQQYRNN
ncbi:MAG: DUF6166 domain-containing protein [Terracidiphilus sp.]|jgi:hypothetical protein